MTNSIELQSVDERVRAESQPSPQQARERAEELGLGNDYHVRIHNNQTLYLPGDSTERLRLHVKRGRDVIEEVPIFPDNLRRITTPWLVRWAQWVAADRPDVTPVDERDLDENQPENAPETVTNDWDPALHPRDPDTGKFVERTFDIPDGAPDFTEFSPRETMQYLDNSDADVDPVLDPNSAITIDGVPNDAESVDDIPRESDDRLDDLRPDSDSGDDQDDTDESGSGGDGEFPEQDDRALGQALGGGKFKYGRSKDEMPYDVGVFTERLAATDDDELIEGVIEGLEFDSNAGSITERPTTPHPRSGPDAMEAADISDEFKSENMMISGLDNIGVAFSHLDGRESTEKLLTRMEDNGYIKFNKDVAEKAYAYAPDAESREYVRNEFPEALGDKNGEESLRNIFERNETYFNFKKTFIKNWTDSFAGYAKHIGGRAAENMGPNDNAYVFHGGLPFGEFHIPDHTKDKFNDMREEARGEIEDGRELYRGIQNPITTHSSMESWSYSKGTAEDFNTQAVMSDDVANERVLFTQEMIEDVNEDMFEQEVVVLGGGMDVPPDAKPLPGEEAVFNADMEKGNMRIVSGSTFETLMMTDQTEGPFMFEKEPKNGEPSAQSPSQQNDESEFSKESELTGNMMPHDRALELGRTHYKSPMEAKANAKKMGVSGYHLRKVNGKTYYAPGDCTVDIRGNKRARDIIKDLPIFPDNLRRITKPWLVRWAQWVAAGRPDVVPVDERDLERNQPDEAPKVNDWNPALHPRDPDTGKFVERSFSLPDTGQDFTKMKTKKTLGFIQDNGGDIGGILNPNDAITVDGVPNDATSLDDIPDPETEADNQAISEMQELGYATPNAPELRADRAETAEPLQTSSDGKLGAASSNMEVLNFAEGHTGFKKNYRDTIDGSRADGEKPTLAEREIAADQFLRNLGFSENVPEQFKHDDENYMVSAKVDGEHTRMNEPDGAANMDKEKFERFLAAIFIAGNSDMHGDNMVVRGDGSFAAIDLNKSGGDFTLPGKFRSRGVRELVSQARQTNLGWDDESDLQAAAEDLAEELDKNVALDGVENSDLSDEGMHQFRDNIEGNIDALRNGEIEL